MVHLLSAQTEVWQQQLGSFYGLCPLHGNQQHSAWQWWRLRWRMEEEEEEEKELGSCEAAWLALHCSGH